MVMANDKEDPNDPNAQLTPLMYDAGVYFLCDVARDTHTHALQIPYTKTFTPHFITQAYRMSSLDDLKHALGFSEVTTGHREPHAERTANRSSRHTTNVQLPRPPNH